MAPVASWYPTVVMQGRGYSFYIPPKNYCNLIDPEASDGEVEELLLLEFERLEVDKVVEG